jgi:hypothetical protein
MNKLLKMCIKCECLKDARKVFGKISKRNSVIWAIGSRARAESTRNIWAEMQDQEIWK